MNPLCWRNSESARWFRALAVLIVLAVGLTCAAYGSPPAFAAAQTWIALSYVPGPPDNPLKGFVPFLGAYDTFPHSMEWTYVPWKEVQTDFNSFTWGTIDRALADTASRGHHAIFRIYADYPDTPYAVPAFLSSVSKRPYSDPSNGTHATSYSPDYEDKNLVRAMTNTIRALGERYDGDPRIAFIAVGFLGFWGEWHTYRASCKCDTWMASFATQTAVLNTFDQAFNRTKLVVRYPDVGWTGQAMGFHDDAFADQTLAADWTFVGRLKAANATSQWRTQPIGGELFPGSQWCAFAVPSCTAQSFDASVDATHASWLINHYAFEHGYGDPDDLRALAGARRLGYDLFVSAVSVANTTPNDRLAVSIRMQNRGVAPFPYDWTLELAAADVSNRIVAVYRTNWPLTKVVDRGVDVELSHQQPRHRLPAGEYTLLMRALNPLVAGKPLVFANTLWGRNVANWLTLGTFEVAPRRARQ